jgi:very-short-patch-repair endonuclease
MKNEFWRMHPTLPSTGRETAQRSGGVATSRRLRHGMTDAEWKMRHVLRDMDWPQAHFRRQVKIGTYFADFLSHAFKLVIEVDGLQHAEAAGLRSDARRTAYLESQGYRVLRFANAEVLKNPAGVHDAIVEFLQKLSPTPRLRRVPSPQGGGSKEDCL